MYYGRGRGSSSTDRVQAAVSTLERHCKTLGLMDTDYGKAIVRIKVNGFDADLDNLKLKASKDATWQEEAVAEALLAFKRARSQIKSPDCDGDTFEGEYVEAMERAVQLLC